MPQLLYTLESRNRKLIGYNKIDMANDELLRKKMQAKKIERKKQQII